MEREDMAVRGKKVGSARVAVPKRAGVIVKQSFDGERVGTRRDASGRGLHLDHHPRVHSLHGSLNTRELEYTLLYDKYGCQIPVGAPGACGTSYSS